MYINILILDLYSWVLGAMPTNIERDSMAKFEMAILGVLVAMQGTAAMAGNPVASHGQGCRTGATDNDRCCSTDVAPTWWCTDPTKVVVKKSLGCTLALSAGNYTGDLYRCQAKPVVPPPVVQKPRLKAGMSFLASDQLRDMGIETWQISQTMGNAAASAGTHAKDGTDKDGAAYSAAVDLSAYTTSAKTKYLSDSAIQALLEDLGRHGFAAFYRNPGHDHWPAGEVRHIHAVYVDVAMKRMLRDQLHDWANGRNGLASHAAYLFWQPSDTAVGIVRDLFVEHNPASN